MQDYFEIGQIVNTVGLKGELKVKPFTDNVKQFETLKNVLIDVKGTLQEVKISKVRYYKELVMIYLEGVDSIERRFK